MENIASRIFRYRDRNRLTQAEMGDLLGVTGKYVGMLERGAKAVEEESTLVRLLKRMEADEGGVAGDVAAAHGRGLLKAARKKKGLTPSQLAAAVGYSLSVYQAIEDGSSQMSRKMAERVAKELDIDADDLLGGGDHPPSNGTHFGTVGETPELRLPPGQKARFVPLLSFAQCGTMHAYDDGAYDHDGFLAMNPADRKAFAVELAGDSMSPVFGPGDVAVVYPSNPPRSGGVVIARLNEENGGDVMLKLYQISGDNVTLSSYNPAYPPMSYPRQTFAWIYPVASVTKVLH